MINTRNLFLLSISVRSQYIATACKDFADWFNLGNQLKLALLPRTVVGVIVKCLPV